MKCKDHLGNEFDSLRDMCKHYGIGIETFRMRMRYKWTLERALTQRIRCLKKCKDHLGNEFKSELEMCRYWHINLFTFRSRMSGNWSLKDALTMPVLGVGSSIPARDHLGKDYPSMSAMFRAWGWDVNHAFAKLGSGKVSIKELLTHSYKREEFGNNRSCKDHLGNEFKSIKDLCRHWKVDYSIFYARYNAKRWTVERALTEPVRHKRKKDGV